LQNEPDFDINLLKSTLISDKNGDARRTTLNQERAEVQKSVDELRMERRAMIYFFEHHVDLHDEFCSLYELVEEGKDPSTYYRRTE
jgi:hypothetical protein